MPTLDQLIQINVTRQTTAIPQAGFGSALVLSFETTEADGFPSGGIGVYTKDDFGDVFGVSTEVYKCLNAYFSQSLTPIRAYVGYVKTTDTAADGDGGAQAALNRILAAADGVEGNFYAICPVGTTLVASLAGVAKWTEANKRVCFIKTEETAALAAFDSGDTSAEIANVVKNANYSRTSVWYGTEDDENISGAIAGRCLPTTPGSTTFAYKQLSGITTAPLTTTQVGFLDGKDANYYRDFAGRSSTFTGKMADGGFIDIIRDSDWIESRLREAIAFIFVNEEKVPYTEAGADVLEASFRSVVEEAIRNGILDDDYSITKTAVLEASSNDRANRKFPEMTLNARFTGAIHSASFQLTLSV